MKPYSQALYELQCYKFELELESIIKLDKFGLYYEYMYTKRLAP